MSNTRWLQPRPKRVKSGETFACQPSPTGRGQGEGSDITFTSAVTGAGVRRLKDSPTLPPRIRTNEGVLLTGEVRRCTRGPLAPSPITAEEKATSDPSPCPLPVGEGWRRGRQRRSIVGLDVPRMCESDGGSGARTPCSGFLSGAMPGGRGRSSSVTCPFIFIVEDLSPERGRWSGGSEGSKPCIHNRHE